MLALASVRNEAAISPCIRTIQWRGQQGLYNECSLVSEVHWEVRMDAGQWGVQRWSMFMSCGLLTHRVQEGSWCWLGRFRGVQSGWRDQHDQSLRERQCCGLCANMKDKSQKS